MRIKDFVGNQGVVARLTKTGLPQSCILAGPEGVGKRTLALLLAARAQCYRPADGDACGECESCLRVTAGTHPDLFLVEPLVGRKKPDLPARVKYLTTLNLDAPKKKDRKARIIEIDQIRELNRDARFRPFCGKSRLYVLDPADLMNDEAANALLKTLEEPPETTHIALVTAHPDSLLPTIRSRCQLFRFCLLSREELTRYLVENTDLDRPQLRAAFAGGSLGRALTLDLERYLEGRQQMMKFLTAGLSGSFSSVFGQLEEGPMRKMLKERGRIAEAMRQLEVLAFDLYYINAGTPERALNQDLVARLRELGESVSLDHLRRLLHHMEEARRDVERYVRPVLCLEGLWLDFETEMSSW